ncbi:PorP/SprF family type IX secretion system membrane protein [Rubrolithibacter danxiaensis]|uniref:PorP/SprF family type IX secretion system membrane protein n=1 Tax=Rubrolithibacter danxiaensis TaxID=3390805 RepID=UPI003BF7E380
MKIVELKKTGFVLILLLLTSVGLKAQQSFTYTQYMDNLTPVNPAFSLLNPLGSLDLIARKQWVGIKGSPSTLLLDAYMPVGTDEKTMIGAIILQDNLAVETQSEFNAFIARSVQISATDFLALSLNFGARRYVSDFSSLDADDSALKGDIREIAANLGFGIMAFGKDDNGETKYFAGLSAPRLSIRTLGLGGSAEKQNLKDQFYITAGFFKNITDGIRFKPAVLVSHAPNVPLQADISGTFYLQNKFGVGLNYRSNNELGGIFSVNVGERLHFGYSYQMVLSSARIGSFGNDTHEIAFSYKLKTY